MRRIILLIAILAILPFSPGITVAREADAGAADGSLKGSPDTAALEIVCSGLRNGDSAVFDVYGPEGRKIYSVALKGTGNVVRRRIIGLEPGHYRVECAKWEWTYVKTPATLEKQLAGGETVVFSFSTSKRSGIPLNYEEGKLNVFKLR